MKRVRVCAWLHSRGSGVRIWGQGQGWHIARLGAGCRRGRTDVEQARRVAEHGHAHSAVSRAPGQQLRAQPAEAQHGRARPAVVEDVLHACQRPCRFKYHAPVAKRLRRVVIRRGGSVLMLSQGPDNDHELALSQPWRLGKRASSAAHSFETPTQVVSANTAVALACRGANLSAAEAWTGTGRGPSAALALI